MARPAIRTPVLVVGAGVAGCVLALELAHHGVPSTVVERASRPPRHRDLNLVSGRGMELLRRLGLAAALRADAVDPDRSADIAWTRSIGEDPVLVTAIPSAGELRHRYAANTDGSTPVEPYLLVTGADLTRRLRDAVRAHALVDLREGWTFTDLRQVAGGTVATVLDGATRTRHAIEADFLAGCDGAQSTVRRCLGVAMEEPVTPAHHCTVYFHSAGLSRSFPAPAAVIADQVALSRRTGHDAWTGHLPLEPGEVSVADPAELLHRRLGLGFDASQILGVTQWQDALGIAGAYRRGTAYLAGQAAHRFHPPSDRVDTCLGDAVDLGWKLAAAVRRWAGPALLDSYQGERRRRAVLDREALARTLATRRRFGRLVAAGAARDDLAAMLRAAPPQVDPAGTSPGAEYATSPVVWPDAGTRLPAVRLTGGDRLLDRLGPQFTLLDLTADRAGRPLAEAARARGVPLTHLSLPGALPGWASRLLLVRPDHHVAWRSAGGRWDWARVVDVVTGHRAQDHVNT
jgi:2-polyprenyl-6-methoxyphenol hydroxylase-like FAD-dependent oxidoreductase